jgi:hypothetical protein
MQVYNYNTLNRNIGSLLNDAIADDVIIHNYKGKDFRITPLFQEIEKESPFEHVPCLNLNISTEEIVNIIRESREER